MDNNVVIREKVGKSRKKYRRVKKKVEKNGKVNIIIKKCNHTSCSLGTPPVFLPNYYQKTRLLTFRVSCTTV